MCNILLCMCLPLCVVCCIYFCASSSKGCSFFFQAEDGIRDLVRSRGLGDVYKRQGLQQAEFQLAQQRLGELLGKAARASDDEQWEAALSLIHI